MTTQLSHLLVEHLDAPQDLWTARPRFSWVVDAPDETGVTQTAWELELHRIDDRQAEDQQGGDKGADPTVLATGRTTGDDVLVDPLTEDLASATRYTVRVRVWTTADGRDEQPTGWAETHFATSLLHDEWQPVWAEPEQQPVTIDGAATPLEIFDGSAFPTAPPEERLHPVIHLRQAFTLAAEPARAVLRATAQGAYASWLNGNPVGDEVLAPGYESFQQQLSFQSYDVTGQVQAGENVLGIQLADGWFAGRISIVGRSGQYGDVLRATWRLEVTAADGSVTVVEPDDQVRAVQDGPIRYADIFIGEMHDATRAFSQPGQPGWSQAGFDDSAWPAVRLVEVATPVVPFVGQPVRRLEERPVAGVITTPAGETVIDLGQVIAGRLRLACTGERGTRITLEHGEVLDEHGNYLNNIQGPNKDQTDVWVLGGDPDGETWEPWFTFHGFRYVRVTGWPGELRPEQVTAVVVGSDLPTTSSFTSSDERLDRLHANTWWSQRANLLAVPTDCPQRERAGWTGDIQIFGPTAATLMDVRAFMQRWLANVRRDQARDHGGVPIIVPFPPAMDGTGVADANELFEIVWAAGWADVITMLPTALWRHYGDLGFLADNLQAMKDWVAVQERQAREDLPRRYREGGSASQLTEAELDDHALLWNGGLHFGDWLAPSLSDAKDPGSIMAAPLKTSELIGALFAIHSLDLVAQTSGLLGESEAADEYRQRAAAGRAAFARLYVDAEGHLPLAMQGVYVLALQFDCIPQDLRPAALAELVRLVHANGDRLDTGFLSVPYLLDVLWDGGERELARTLLWQDACPSWLYEVDRGATTIWEAWDCIKPDGTVGTMSFNHYAFGCVVDWMYRRLAGLQCDAPGWTGAIVAPDLEGPLDHVAAHVDTPRGRLGIDWTRTGDSARAEVEVPVGCTARVVAPDGWTTDAAELGQGRHTVNFGRD